MTALRAICGQRISQRSEYFGMPLSHEQSGTIRAAAPSLELTCTDDRVLGVQEAIRTFAGDDISVPTYYDFDKDFLLELSPCSMHYESYDG
jgi:hypothetical protein